MASSTPELPRCDVCKAELPHIARFTEGVMGDWELGPCTECEKAKATKMKMVPGASLVLSDLSIAEVSAAVADRSYYTGQVKWINEEYGVVAVFRDMWTGVLYGQAT